MKVKLLWLLMKNNQRIQLILLIKLMKKFLIVHSICWNNMIFPKKKINGCIIDINIGRPNVWNQERLVNKKLRQRNG